MLSSSDDFCLVRLIFLKTSTKRKKLSSAPPKNSYGFVVGLLGTECAKQVCFLRGRVLSAEGFSLRNRWNFFRFVTLVGLCQVPLRVFSCALDD